MSENTGERKKLSLSLDGKLTLKNPVNAKKLTGSITTNTRSGRNTVQVEVKRVKRHNDANNGSFRKNFDTNNKLSAEQISSRSRILKEGLARTAAQAEKQTKVSENQNNNKNNDLTSVSSTKKLPVQNANKKLSNLNLPFQNKNFEGSKQNNPEDLNKSFVKKNSDKEVFKENQKKNILNRGFQEKKTE